MKNKTKRELVEDIEDLSMELQKVKSGLSRAHKSAGKLRYDLYHLPLDRDSRVKVMALVDNFLDNI